MNSIGNPNPTGVNRVPVQSRSLVGSKNLKTIGSLDSMVRSLRDELALLREKDAEHGIERKRLMAVIDAKDISCLTQQMA